MASTEIDLNEDLPRAHCDITSVLSPEGYARMLGMRAKALLPQSLSIISGSLQIRTSFGQLLFELLRTKAYREQIKPVPGKVT